MPPAGVTLKVEQCYLIAESTNASPNVVIELDTHVLHFRLSARLGVEGELLCIAKSKMAQPGRYNSSVLSM